MSKYVHSLNILKYIREDNECESSVDTTLMLLLSMNPHNTCLSFDWGPSALKDAQASPFRRVHLCTKGK